MQPRPCRAVPRDGGQPLNTAGTKADGAICFYLSQSGEGKKGKVKLVNVTLNLKLSRFKRLVKCLIFFFHDQNHETSFRKKKAKKPF